MKSNVASYHSSLFKYFKSQQWIHYDCQFSSSCLSNLCFNMFLEKYIVTSENFLFAFTDNLFVCLLVLQAATRWNLVLSVLRELVSFECNFDHRLLTFHWFANCFTIFYFSAVNVSLGFWLFRWTAHFLKSLFLQILSRVGPRLLSRIIRFLLIGLKFYRRACNFVSTVHDYRKVTFIPVTKSSQIFSFKLHTRFSICNWKHSNLKQPQRLIQAAALSHTSSNAQNFPVHMNCELPDTKRI